MKQKLLVLVLLFITILAFHTLSSAADDPIVCTMEITPPALSEPGDVSVTITISNSGETDMTAPLTLFDPTSQAVKDFGESGSVTLKAGQVITWTGKWNVNQRTLENGQIVYFVKYTLVDEKGVKKTQSQPIRGKIEKSDYSAEISVTRTIVPETAREGQTVNVIYDIVNEGTVSLTNLVLHENKDILPNALPIAAELKSGDAAQIKLPVVMAKKDLTSSGSLTYNIADGTQEQTYQISEKVITYGEPQIVATLSSDSKGVIINQTIKLTLKLDNIGNVDYTNVRVTDPLLGDVFTNQTLPAGEKLTLEKEITLTQTADYQFEILAADKTGAEVSYFTNTLQLIAVDPNKALLLDLTLSSNKTEVYSTSEVVRFTVTITNNSDVDATNVTIYEANTAIYTIASIPAGQSQMFSRDVTLGMAGKYQFRAEAKDVLENTLTFESNTLQIAFLAPTPVPVTPNPNITATPVPTYAKATYPQISDPDIGTLPKLIRSIFYPLIFAGFALFIVALAIMVIATIKRAKNRKASESALDHLERSSHRDYIVPAEEQEQPVNRQITREEEEEEHSVPVETDPESLAEDELPHMKYVRNAYQIAGRDSRQERQPDVYSRSSEPVYSEDEPERKANQTGDDYEDDNPYKRRGGRVSPYARQTEETDQDGDSGQNGYTEDPS